MKIGVFAVLTADSMGPADVARAVADRGFESLFLGEHTHIPVGVTKAPGGPLPDVYRRMLDPFVALTAAACATETLVVGTAVCLVPQRDPIVLAKEVASLDLISGGRVVLGVGAGWNVPEAANHGTAAGRRWLLLEERVLAMKAIWRSEEAEYHGAAVDFDPIWQWPKPVQRPGPPVLVAGSGSRALDRVLNIGEGWLPLAGRDPAPVLEGMRTLLQRARDRDLPKPQITVMSQYLTPRQLDQFAEAGAERCVVWATSNGPDLLAELDRAQPLLAEAGAGEVR